MNDGVMGFEIFRGTTTPLFSKWKVVVNKWTAIAGETLTGLEEAWQEPQEDGTAFFLVESDETLAELKEILRRLNIQITSEVSVELTTQEKQWIQDSGIRSRSDVDATLVRAARINTATTIEDLKGIMMSDASM